PSGKVAVAGFGHPSGATLVDRIGGLIADAGLRRGRTVADVAIVAGVGEPDRGILDDWVQRGIPHLLLRLVEGFVVLGPFVVPGTTACLRCADAETADADPSWPLVLEQYSRQSRRDRPDGATEPVDPILADLGCA